MKQLYYKVGLLLGIFKSEEFVKASQVINKALNIYKDLYNKSTKIIEIGKYRMTIGLCRAMRDAFNSYGMDHVLDGRHIHKILRKFNPGFLNAKYTHTNLMKHPFYYGSPCWGKYWWEDDDYYSRLNALNKLQRYYMANDILIKKSNYQSKIKKSNLQPYNFQETYYTI